MAAKGYFLARDVLWFMVFCGTGVNYIARLNLNIAIVSMVKGYDGSELDSDVQQSECLKGNISSNISNHLSISKDSSTLQDRYDWNEYQQGMVLGAFYWMYWFGQLPGGILSQMYGPKIIFGFSNLGLQLLGYLIPLAASLDYRVLVALRVLQGFVGSLAWPSLHTIVGLWIPPNERSKFISSYMGSSVGGALIYPLCGLLIEWFDWPVVFHVTSTFGVLWFIAWWLLMFDTPAEHPTISEDERIYIEKSLASTVSKKKLQTPWKKIIFSGPMWIQIISQWGNLWGLFTLMTQAPTYFKFIHGWDMSMTGMLSGIPHIARMIVAYIISYGCDYLLDNTSMSRTNVRKIATGCCCLLQGAFVFCLAFTGCNYMAAIVFLTIATACSGGEAAGALGSLVDLSPNFTGVMCGISQLVSVIPGTISPIVVSIFTYKNQTIEQWQKVYFVTTGVLVVPGIIHLLFASSELQDWNSPEELDQELQTFKTAEITKEQELNKKGSDFEDNHKIQIYSQNKH